MTIKKTLVNVDVGQTEKPSKFALMLEFQQTHSMTRCTLGMINTNIAALQEEERFAGGEWFIDQDHIDALRGWYEMRGLRRVVARYRLEAGRSRV
jgi:hypothetical protein